MNIFYLSLYFRYMVNLYIKNLVAILFGLSLAFASIDYFQYSEKIAATANYKILYLFYMWQEALGLLYPLAIVFAVILTKLALVKSNTMGALHAFGYSKAKLFFPIFIVSLFTYAVFTFLHTTEFSYAKDKANAMLENQINAYDVNDLFFKYNSSFVYIKKLNPVKKEIENITIFKVDGYRVLHTIYAPIAYFNGTEWDAKNAILRTHIYKNGKLRKYNIEHKKSIKTLKGYKPKIIKSLYEGKALNIIDAYNTWQLLKKQELNSDKIRAVLYDKVIIPLFSIALTLILFFKMPFHARMMNIGSVIAFSMGVTFVIWGILFGLNQVGSNGVLIPEFTAILPVTLLWIYAIYVFFTDENSIA